MEANYHTKFLKGQTVNIFMLWTQIENLEDLLKEKDNQVDLAKSKLSQVMLKFCKMPRRKKNTHMP